MDFQESHNALFRAIAPSMECLLAENAELKAELEALKKQYDLVIFTLENNIDSVLRVVREGRSEL